MKKLAFLLIIIAIGCTNLQAQRLMKPKSHKPKIYHVDRKQKVKKRPKGYGYCENRTIPYAVKDTNSSIVNLVTSTQKSSALNNTKQFGTVYDKNNPFHNKYVRKYMHLNKDVINLEEVPSQESSFDSTYSLNTLYNNNMLRDVDMVCALLLNAPCSVELLRNVRKFFRQAAGIGNDTYHTEHHVD